VERVEQDREVMARAMDETMELIADRRARLRLDVELRRRVSQPHD
jgi:hypothetical protein